MATPPSQSPEALLRAMTPIDKFLDVFIASFDNNDSRTSWAQPDVGQAQLAALVAKVTTPPFVPTRRFLRLLLTRYASMMERDDAAEKRKAIFATTFRNEKTFALFTNELRREGISCNYAEKEAIASLPNIFPCYFTQPRSDVRICTMTMD